MHALNEEAFKEALSHFPSGVTIVTTTDAEGRHWGFTASSFTSVSARPPLVLVCLANSADSHAAFAQTRRFAINILGHEHREVALHFSRKHADKFAGQDFRFGTADEPTPPVLRGTAAALICDMHGIYALGDHTVLVGEVRQAQTHPCTPLVYVKREFHAIEREPAELGH